MYYSIQLYFMQEKYIHFTTVEPGYSEIIAIVKGSVGFMHFTIARFDCTLSSRFKYIKMQHR